ncbi:glucosaminidase domain-containing protein [uncultured Winogradskyella sp.]|uniref:glucosaminidase domain-containing protein n=1 Tax=uncultured Winogradskyella sp. TaxID=395353 RepID=UPI00261E50E7|nr:glucosaminidase domain-containing protein [uncultured Winogradskyella sp.]
MRLIFKYTTLVLITLVFSCGPKKGIVTKKKRQNTEKEVIVKETETSKVETTSQKDSDKIIIKVPTSTDAYINRFAAKAKEEMLLSKIPASITLAQGILESGSGRGRLAVEANNHFGIKCHGWQGEKIYHDDDRSQECFRKYERPERSYKDHSDFLVSRKRYASLFKLKPDDYKGWAKGLKNAGYATDRKYPQKLISLIERYKLYKYDDEVLSGNPTDMVRVNSGVLRYVVEQGDTLYALAKRYNTSVKAIKELNNMTSNDLSIGQEIMIPN